MVRTSACSVGSPSVWVGEFPDVAAPDSAGMGSVDSGGVDVESAVTTGLSSSPRTATPPAMTAAATTVAPAKPTATGVRHQGIDAAVRRRICASPSGPGCTWPAAWCKASRRRCSSGENSSGSCGVFMMYPLRPRGHGGTQPGHAPREVALDGAAADLHGFGDLRLDQAAVVAEHDGLALSPRQLAQRIDHGGSGGIEQRFVLGAGCMVRWVLGMA